MQSEPQPLAATLARVAAIDKSLAADTGAIEDDWFPATAFATPDAPHFDDALARSVAEYPTADRRVRSSFFFGNYSWYLPSAAIACFLGEQRVPDLSPANIALRYGKHTWHEGDESGEYERLEFRFLSGRFAALPSDPAANHPDALIVPDPPALREWLRERLEEHLTPLIQRIYSTTGYGKRAQWNLAADSCASMFQHAGEKLERAEYARAEGLAVVKAPGSPLRNPNTGYVTLEYNGHSETFSQRGGCCLYYKVDPGNNCSTCVLRPEEERTRMLLEYMATEHGQPAGDAA